MAVVDIIASSITEMFIKKTYVTVLKVETDAFHRVRAIRGGKNRNKFSNAPRSGANLIIKQRSYI